MRTDPSETGGLFVSRRPGTRPTRYRETPRVEARRQRADSVLAAALLGLMALINLSFWGPLPLACLWLAGRTQYLTDSVGLALIVAFATLGAGLGLGLAALKRLDWAWILVRRASGHDQRQGMMARIFTVCCAVGASGFGIWLIFFSGARLSGGVNIM
jgi:hypothetical protein